MSFITSHLYLVVMGFVFAVIGATELIATLHALYRYRQMQLKR